MPAPDEFDPDPEVKPHRPVGNPAWVKGMTQPPGSGRQAGKLNRHAELVDWAERLTKKFPVMELEDIGRADPIKVLMHWFWTGRTHTGIVLKVDDVIDIGKIIAPYIRPRLSSVEMVAEIDHRASIEEQAKLAADPEYRKHAEGLMEVLAKRAAEEDK